MNVAGVAKPVIHVFDDATGELVYALRALGPTFRPHVFAGGSYRVRVSDPERGKSAELKELTPVSGEPSPIKVTI